MIFVPYIVRCSDNSSIKFISTQLYQRIFLLHTRTRYGKQIGTLPF